MTCSGDMHEFYFGLVSNDPKNGHLKVFEGAFERLTQHKVDLLHLDSVRSVINGRHSVFSYCFSFTHNPEEMVEPTVNGAKDVIIVTAEAKVRCVVFTSSIGAVYMDPERSIEPLGVKIS